MVQSASCFVERKLRKVDNQEKRDLMAEPVEIRVTSGAEGNLYEFYAVYINL
jgi:hypothetical protein